MTAEYSTTDPFKDQATLEAWADRTADRIAAMDEPPGPEDPRQSPHYDPTVQLYRIHAAMCGLEEDLEKAVRECRERGVSWHKIGMALGVTGEAVRQRFGKERKAKP